MSVEFTDNSDEILQKFKEATEAGLTSIGIKATEYAAKACAVDTGRLRNSIEYKVVDTDVYIGTNAEYAAYVELGTGQYYPGGRDAPWRYKDAKGKWHTTSGAKPQPYLKPAATEHTETYKNILKTVYENA